MGPPAAEPWSPSSLYNDGRRHSVRKPAHGEGRMGAGYHLTTMSTAALLALVTILQTIPAPGPQAASLVGDAGRLAAATSNEARFDVLTALLRGRGLTFAVEPFTIEKPIGREPRTEGRNVVVTLGDGPEEIVIGAHYDAVRLADGSLSPGAVDNAASSVMLIRLADVLRTEKLPVRIRVVWFDMEELGLVGSAQYVKQHSADRIGAMLNFDINAYGDTIVFGPSRTERECRAAPQVRGDVRR